MGLVQRSIESSGIPTISITSFKELTQFISVPRSVYYRAPRGASIGMPNDITMQKGVLMEALSNAQGIEKPGTMIKGNFKWRK